MVFSGASLPPPRGLPAEQLASVAQGGGISASAHGTVAEALLAARAAAGAQDRIVVCGSFLTVAAALEEARWGT